MESIKNPCRLFVILAREAPKGVILRRGPSKWVQLILWHTDTDSFEYGQWFHGKIYGRRCDLSPNGSKFIYFAQKITGRTLKDTEYTYAWTAISKPPYLTALALWPKGDCWHGGGLFMNHRTVWLNHKPEVATPHPEHKPRGLTIVANPQAYGEDEPIYYKRLARDGWVNTQEGALKLTGKWNLIEEVEKPDVWERAHPEGKHSLVMEWVGLDFSGYGDPRIDEFWVVDRSTNERTAIEQANWADWDQRGRLVFTRHGRLFTDELEGGRPNPELVADFNSQRRAEVIAPVWARHW